MNKLLSLILVAAALSGCSQYPWSFGDLATTGVALANGGREAGAATVCGSDPATVLACSAALKFGGYRAVKAVTGSPEKAKKVIEYGGTVGTINNVAALAGVGFPASLVIGIAGAQMVGAQQVEP